MTTRTLLLFLAVTGISAGAAAQDHAKAHTAAKQMPGDAAKLHLAMTAAPADITKGATIVDVDDKGAMRQLRAGTNGWTCTVMPTAKAGTAEAMCADKTWTGWGEAYMAKKTPPKAATVGVAYMLHGDHGTSNTDPFATAPTATNQWVVSPSHVMLLVPDMKLLDAMPTDPRNGGPWVMWKGSPYAHVMVPLATMATARNTTK
jgi:hypothetical protein